ncbi:glycoside hydrolase family 108 protein [Chachezhania sediminis]|uniref:glycoside hydrolase family 108 protein n=1 Tax=Chachezhania sediminis TaxID=2599291 RepID=UPI00131DE788|nr:glycoside hydrolase family 108 protein [Chachezhania sediminis]
MTDRFARALPRILAHEGGFVNHPADPGGATNRGITQATYNGWLKSQGRASRPVQYISDAEVAAIYGVQYWDAIRGDELPAGVAYAVFDAAVNSGPARAAKWLQAAVGVTADGVIGVQTLAAAAKAPAHKVIDAMCDARLAFLKRLRAWPTFGKGWTRRVADVRQLAHMWATDEDLAPPKVASAPGAGAGPEKPLQPVLDAIKSPAAMGGVGSTVAAVVAAADGDGPLAYALSAVLVLAAVAAIIWLMKRRGA